MKNFLVRSKQFLTASIDLLLIYHLARFDQSFGVQCKCFGSILVNLELFSWFLPISGVRTMTKPPL